MPRILPIVLFDPSYVRIDFDSILLWMTMFKSMTEKYDVTQAIKNLVAIGYFM